MDKPGSSSSSSSSSTGTSVTPLEPETAAPLAVAAPLDSVVTKQQLQELAKEIDPNARLDDDVEDCLLNYAEEFLEEIVAGSCDLATHRKSSTLEEKDVQMYLKRNCDLWTPGFGREEVKTYEPAPVLHSHKQRLALAKKAAKKK